MAGCSVGGPVDCDPCDWPKVWLGPWFEDDLTLRMHSAGTEAGSSGSVAACWWVGGGWFGLLGLLLAGLDVSICRQR